MLFFPKNHSLVIATGSDSIGTGMIVQHGLNTGIAALRIGKNFFVNQNVTIAWKENQQVVIGNDVQIRMNAIVLGGVTIGNGAIIGPGAVVTMNIPAYSIVMGNPAKVIGFTKDIDEIVEFEQQYSDEERTDIEKLYRYYERYNANRKEIAKSFTLI